MASLAHTYRLSRRSTLRAILALLMGSIVSFAVAAQTAGEYQVKAVFLYNFAQFVEWPKRVDDSSPFIVGVLGDDPFHHALEDAFAGERVNARRFEVKRFRSVDEALDCDILFISASKSREVREITSALKDRPVLTVSDVQEFARQGGMIQFVMDDKHIKFLINVESARAADLTLSSKLLRSATIVSSQGRDR